MKQHIHILGVCGTFMGSLAQLAKAAGYKVTGCDAGVYPPMSTQLEQAGIELTEGFDPSQLSLNPDVWVIGNVVSRGNPLMEAILDRGLTYVSGPQWFADHILKDKWVLGVSGTHGKTSTTSMLAWILEFNGFKPGFLVGGVPKNFGVSARLGGSDFFVVEADEYDTAFFDKRSKFVHYHPKTLIINNLEFDHADIFSDLASIQRQFHHLIRIVSSNGLIVSPENSAAIDGVFEQGCWTDSQRSLVCDTLDDLEADMRPKWLAVSKSKDSGPALENSLFDVYFEGEKCAEVSWPLSGEHNVQNALHAIAAARHIGILPEHAAEALNSFDGVARRMELITTVGGVTVYDDFAHHPTAIESTLDGLRSKVGDAPIIAVIEPRSNTMKLGVHKDSLSRSVASADQVHWYQDPNWEWLLTDYVLRENGTAHIHTAYDAIFESVLAQVPEGAHIVVMSNGGFDGMSKKIADALELKSKQGLTP